jgi:hypothetical protein
MLFSGRGAAIAAGSSARSRVTTIGSASSDAASAMAITTAFGSPSVANIGTGSRARMAKPTIDGVA